MNVAERALDNKHHQENRDLLEMGFTIHDKEFWQESERQKAEWSALRPSVTIVVDEVTGEQTVSTSTERRCTECNTIMPAPSGRGRPAKRCAKCRGVK